MEQFLPLDEQLNILFEEIPHAEGRNFKLQEVSDATGISLGTLSHIRNGRIANPGIKSMREICQFFGVPLRYFETTSREDCYHIIATRHLKNNEEMGEIAFRATQLSPKSQHDVLTIIKWVQAAEELRKAGKDIPHLSGLELLRGDSSEQ